MRNENRVFGYVLASKSDRLFGTLIEGILFLIVISIAFKLVGVPMTSLLLTETDLVGILISIIQGLVLGAIFYPMFIGNLGHRIFGLKVISAETGEDYKNYDEGALRECLKAILGYFVIPNIWILWDSKNQNLYDKLTKTYVVKKYTI